MTLKAYTKLTRLGKMTFNKQVIPPFHCLELNKFLQILFSCTNTEEKELYNTSSGQDFKQLYRIRVKQIKGHIHALDETDSALNNIQYYHCQMMFNFNEYLQKCETLKMKIKNCLFNRKYASWQTSLVN